MSADILHYTINQMLEILDFQPQNSGLHIDIRNQMSYNPFPEPYTTGNYTILIVKKGYITLDVNLTSIVLGPFELLIINPHWVIYLKEFDQEVEFITISFEKFWLTHTTQNSSSSFTLLTPDQPFTYLLNQDQLHTLTQVSELIDLKNKRNTNLSNHKLALSHLFSLLLLELQQIAIDNKSPQNKTLTAKEQLTKDFLEILAIHFKSQRTLSFYANKLCVTTGYLAKAVKQVTGKTTGELIVNAIITHASLLLSNTSNSVGEIAQELHFSTTSFFGKFFKRETGYSPREYRKQH